MTFRFRWLALALPLMGVLSACGKGGSSSSDDTVVTLISSTSVLGQTGFTTNSANQGGPAGATTDSQPQGGFAATTSGTYYLADLGNSRVLGFNSMPTVTNTPANFVLGQADFTGSTASTGAGVFAFPQSVSVGNGKLVVADTSNNRVLIWNTAPTGNVPPDVVVGQADLTTNSSGVTQTQLTTPAAATIANNHLFVVDQGNNRVLIWNTVPTTNGAPADVVLGQTDFTSNSSAITQTKMQQPAGIWSDGFRLLVADTGNNRVLLWNAIPNTSGTGANYVIGQSSFTFSTPSPSATTMSTPIGVASDSTRIFVADSGYNRVLIFNLFPTQNGVTADFVLGQEDFTHVTANDDSGASTSPQDGVAEKAPTARTLSRPTGVFDQGGTLYVTDRGNNRVLLFSDKFVKQ